MSGDLRRKLTAVLIAGLVVLLGALVTATVDRFRASAAMAADQFNAYTPPKMSAPTTSPFKIKALTNSLETESASVQKAKLWPALLGRLLQTSVSVRPYPQREGRTSPPAPDDTSVVILQTDDPSAAFDPLEAARAMRSEVASAGVASPFARLYVLGPAHLGDVSQSRSLEIRDALRSGAEAAGATWLDPVAEKWLPNGSQAESPKAGYSANEEEKIASRLAIKLGVAGS